MSFVYLFLLLIVTPFTSFCQEVFLLRKSPNIGLPSMLRLKNYGTDVFGIQNPPRNYLDLNFPKQLLDAGFTRLKCPVGYDTDPINNEGFFSILFLFLFSKKYLFL